MKSKDKQLSEFDPLGRNGANSYRNLVKSQAGLKLQEKSEKFNFYPSSFEKVNSASYIKEKIFQAMNELNI